MQDTWTFVPPRIDQIPDEDDCLVVDSYHSVWPRCGEYVRDNWVSNRYVAWKPIPKFELMTPAEKVDRFTSSFENPYFTDSETFKKFIEDVVRDVLDSEQKTNQRFVAMKYHETEATGEQWNVRDTDNEYWMILNEVRRDVAERIAKILNETGAIVA